jgi:predicted MFS family arabinose efflux permease
MADAGASPGMIATAVPAAISARAAQNATRAAFLVTGLGMSAWAPLVPFAKARAGVGDGSLGLLLLCLGAGSICAMPFAGAFAGRAGARAAILASGVVIAAILPVLAVADSVIVLGLALFVFGAALGMIDVAMNLLAVVVERASGRAMMSGFHGLFSLGGILGAVVVSALLSLGLPPLGATLTISLAIAVLLLVSARHLLSEGRDASTPPFAIPRGPVVIIGLLCFIVFLAEGAMLDWSALVLTTLKGADPAHGGLGYAAFSVAMTTGRLTGDRVVQKLGSYRVVLLGSVCAAAGFVLAVLLPGTSGALAGFVLIGLGASNIVPVLFTATGRQTVMPPNLAIAAVTGIGYLGILAGPALIGFVAHGVGLAGAFLLVGALLLVVAARSGVASR